MLGFWSVDGAPARPRSSDFLKMTKNIKGHFEMSMHRDARLRCIAHAHIQAAFSRSTMNDNTPTHDGNLHSFAESYCPPPENPAAPLPTKKAKRRRKRHAPPGPAGVWFQSQVVNNTSSTNSNSIQNTKDEEHMAAPDVSSCPAWMWMQASLNLCTPYLPRHYSIQERFQHQRPLLPDQYILLPEILQPSSPLSLENKSLLVLVHAAAVQYHSYWTMELRDECGASIKAWMDPLLEEKEMMHLLQMGVVWLLRNIVVLVDAVTHQPWLLLTKESIQRAWTPQQASQEFSDEHYIEWMTKRSQLTTNEPQNMTNNRSTNYSNSNNLEEMMEQDEEEEEEQQVIDVDMDTTRTHQQDNTIDDEEEENVAAILPRNFAAASRSVVTSRVTTTLSTSGSEATS